MVYDHPHSNQLERLDGLIKVQKARIHMAVRAGADPHLIAQSPLSHTSPGFEFYFGATMRRIAHDFPDRRMQPEDIAAQYNSTLQSIGNYALRFAPDATVLQFPVPVTTMDVPLPAVGG